MGSVWLHDLANAARTSKLKVIEIPGWRTRGHGGMATRPQGLVCHHTAGRPTASRPYPSLGVVRDGRPGLPGPLSQLGLGGDLTVRVIAAGRCWHAGLTFQSWQNNDHSIGIEAEHPGGSTPWSPAMYEAYVQLAHALWEWYDFELTHIMGHKEVAKPKGRKPDPTFNMSTFRTNVATYTNTEVPDVTPAEVDAVAKKVAAILIPKVEEIEQRYTLGMQEWERQTDSADAQRAGDAAARALLSPANLDKLATAVASKMTKATS